MSNKTSTVKTKVKYITARFSILQICYFFTMCPILSYVTLYLQTRGLSLPEIGTTVAFCALITGTLQPILGNLSDSKPEITPKRIIIVLSLMAMCGSVSLIYLTEKIWILFFYSFTSICIQTLQPFINALGLSYGKEVNFGVARGAGSISYSFAAQVLGILIAQFDVVCINIFTVICLVAVFLCLFMFKKTQNQENFYDKLKKQKKAVSTRKFLKTYFIFSIMMIANFFFNYANNGANTYLINIVNDLGGDSLALGSITAISTFLEFPAMVIYKPLSKKIPCEHILIFASFMFAVKMLFCTLATDIIYVYIGYLFQLVSFGLYFPAIVDYGNTKIPKQDSVKAQSLIISTATIAYAVAAFTGGFVINLFGAKIAFFINALAAVICGLIMIYCVKLKKKERNAKR